MNNFTKSLVNIGANTWKLSVSYNDKLAGYICFDKNSNNKVEKVYNPIYTHTKDMDVCRKEIEKLLVSNLK